MSYIPVHLNLLGKRVLFVGGGKVNERRIEQMLEIECEKVVVSPQVTSKIAQWADEGKVLWLRKEFEPADAAGFFMAFVAVPRGIERSIVDALKGRGVLVECASDHSMGDFIFPAVVRIGNFLASVSTCGRDPKLSARAKRALEEVLKSL